MVEERTSIGVKLSTRAVLTSMKVHHRESFDECILRLCELAKRGQ